MRRALGWCLPYLLLGCGGGVVRVVELPTGVRVEVLEEGQGPPVAADRLLAFHYDGRLADGTLFDSSRGRDEAFLALPTADGPLLPGLRDGLLELRAGARARIVIPPAEAYQDVGKGMIPPGATLTYEVEVLESAARTASGIWIHHRHRGEGAAPKEGEHVILHYRGFVLPSGREFRSEQEARRPLEFDVGAGQELPGLEAAVQEMAPGGRAVAVLPPELAYGDLGLPPQVPGNTPVWFELELVGVRPRR